MRRFVLLLIGFSMLSIIPVLTSGRAAEKSVKQIKETPKAISVKVPNSLDTLYPPKARQPFYLFRMLGLGTAFASIVSDLFDNEPQHAKANFERFKAQYIEVSKLVPQWQKDFPMSPVDGLGAALKTGDKGKVMAAYEKAGKVCHDCHTVYMPIVQQKYHWGDFYAISIKDPLTNEKVAFSQLMKFLDANFAGISVTAERGEREKAQRHLQGFNARFQAMKETCKNCHDTDRKYYVDESVQALIEKLVGALSGSSVDPKVVEPLRQRIGMESCFKCHLVHVPAAFAKF